MEEEPTVILRPDIPNPTATERLIGYLIPSVLISRGIYHYVLTFLYVLLIKRQPLLLFHFKRFRDLAFARFWIANGEALAGDMPAELTPLLSSLHGTVLDIGPGSGDQLYRYKRSAPHVTRIYGAEPAEDLYPKLVKKASEAGFEGKYHVLCCGAEPQSLIPPLEKEGLLENGSNGGIFDEVVSVRVLCGVPDLKETVGGLYKVLKPGGRLIVMEHVVANKNVAARCLQAGYMWLGAWKFWMRGCCLDRDTEQVLREAGEWSKVEIKLMNTWSTIPQIVGYLVKK